MIFQFYSFYFDEDTVQFSTISEISHWNFTKWRICWWFLCTINFSHLNDFFSEIECQFFLVFCTNSTKYCRLWFQMNKFECRINVLLSLSYPIRKAFDGWFRFAAQFHYSVESISCFSYGTTEYRYFSFLSAQPKKKFNSQHQLDT